MQNSFVIVAHVPTDSVMKGFIPELRRRSQPLLIVTDQIERHLPYIESGLLDAEELLAVDVFNPAAILNLLSQHQVNPSAVFTNSDHLQTSTSIVADFYGLPRKDWHACYRAKNKLVMRQTIQDASLDNVWFHLAYTMSDLQVSDIHFPCIAKPVEGVASENVILAEHLSQLEEYAKAFWRSHPGQPLLLEEFLSGSLHSLETLGDGTELHVMGSFATTLSEPPYFIELGRRFSRAIDESVLATLLEQLRALGVGFGSCHTEFVMTQDGPRLIEVNYRNIGDQSDFLLAEALEFDLFAALVDLYLGLPLRALPDGSQTAFIDYQIAKQSGVIGDVPVAQSYEKDGCKISFRPVCEQGAHHKQDNSNRDYLSVLWVTGASEQMVQPIFRQCIEAFRIQVGEQQTEETYQEAMA
ncbi:ATP-grasp domain-containing protein [Marinomonas fungiae]|uniref:ATP-grasp domain-containing protein n=1 Tax=Marinomonas fungiae TaxID=1137284 RepID=UPI003A8FBFD1